MRHIIAHVAAEQLRETMTDIFNGRNILQTSDKSSNGRPTCPDVWRMLSADRIFQFRQTDGPDRYTQDFKYPHNQKSASVKSGDRGGDLPAAPANDSVFPERLYQECLNQVSSGLVAPFFKI
ncbi:hypothetical protein TNCV_1063441 [Trichonephila clavipes]|nr:hypothetical protein TNCV_1063441 [Trichonephila clavipes]